MLRRFSRRAFSAKSAVCLPAAVLALLLAACSPDTAPPPPVDAVKRDLAAELGVADLDLEPLRLRLADPDSREHLGQGWSYPEEDEQGIYVWAEGPTSEVELFLAHPADLELWLHGRPFWAEGAPRQRVEVWVEPLVEALPETGADGADARSRRTSLGSFELDPDADRHRFPIPAGAIEPGRSRFVFEMAEQYRPVDWLAGSVDERPLTLRVRSFELVGGVGGETPSLVPPGESSGPRELLRLPAGSSATWFVRAALGDRLYVRAEAEGSAEAVVRVHERELAAEPGAVEIGRPVASATLRAGESTWLSLASDDGDRAPNLVRIEILARAPDGLWSSRAESASLELEAAIVAAAGAAVDGAAVDGGEVAAGEVAAGEVAAGEVAAGEVDAGAGERPDMMIYMVDTLRADHLGAYGYERPISPHFDRFADDAILFTEARAQTSWTRTAVASLFSGLYPQAHGVNGRDDALPEAVDTLAEILAAHGYLGIGVVTNGNAGPRFELGQGFAAYQHLRESNQRPEVHFLADTVDRWIGTWLRGRQSNEEPPPFLLYAHASDPHAPYVPPEPFRSRFAADADGSLGELEVYRAISEGHRQAGEAEAVHLRALYDAEIAFWDHHFGKTLDRLKQAGLYDDMAILVVSDHGEEFFDHGGWEHGRTLYDEQLRVPFVLKLPQNRGAGLRLAGDASHVDVLPTLVQLAGTSVPGEIDGRSLLPSIEDAIEAGTIEAGAIETGANDLPRAGGAPMLAYLALEQRRQRSLAMGEAKLVLDEHGENALFDLELDPAELDNLHRRLPFRAGLLRQEIRRLELELAMRRHAADQAEIDPELRAQLKALGYIP